MKKILILANNDVGLYKFRNEIITALLAKGNKVHISLPNGKYVQEFIDAGCSYTNTEIDRRGINPVTDFKLIHQYNKIVRDIKPDFIIMYTIKPNIYGGMISRKYNIPYYMNVTGVGSTFQKNNMLKLLVIFLYKFSSSKADTIFFENAENQKMFIENKITKYEKTKQINGAGVNLEEHKYIDYPKDSELHFLFIGRIMKEKGIDELLEVIVLINKKFDNIIFDIVGPLEDNYKKKIEELQKNGELKYHGFQYDVKPFVKSSSCVILPSYHEGMSNTLLESGAMGRPLITTDISGCREAVIDQRSGFLVEPFSASDLFEKVKKFIELPWQCREEMAIASHKHIEENFDRKKVVEETISTFDLSQ